jgi:TRAP-type mannitol/chloroaromatic compound transport system permease small subunit
MGRIAAVVRAIDRLNEVIGRALAWLTLLMVLVVFAVVVLRYGLGWGRVWIQEAYVWMHGVLFMLAAGYTLLHGGHVRVDIFYRPAGARHRAWVDLIGTLVLLLPFLVMIAWVSWPYVLESWWRLESSREAGGLRGLFLLKSVLLGFCLLLGLQGLALAGRSLLVLAGHEQAAPPARDAEAPVP